MTVSGHDFDTFCPEKVHRRDFFLKMVKFGQNGATFVKHGLAGGKVLSSLPGWGVAGFGDFNLEKSQGKILPSSNS